VLVYLYQTTGRCILEYNEVNIIILWNSIMIRFVPGPHSASCTQGEAIEYDDIYVSVVMNWFEYKKHK
jgi:hypothetical protein